MNNATTPARNEILRLLFLVLWLGGKKQAGHGDHESDNEEREQEREHKYELLAILPVKICKGNECDLKNCTQFIPYATS